MSTYELRVRMDGPVPIVEVRGVLDEEAANNLLEFAAVAARACRAMQIELGQVDSMTPEAASLLLFRREPWHGFPGKITLRADGKPGRQAVLRAYARRRARSQAP